jgi:uncharacterized protein YdiU (UPF0061 family)
MTGQISTGLTFDNSYARLPPALFARVTPDVPPRPSLVVFNAALARQIGLDLALSEDALARLLSGATTPEGAEPVAMAYAGHQFGGFSILGDGRACLLGEIVTPQGARLDLHFKGSGRTPYSRGGDGKAALGPMLREFLVSEAMHALGVPTTRALSVVATGEGVRRETNLPGAVLARLASSHLRVGSFQYAAATRDPALLRALVDHAVARHLPEAAKAERPALALFDHVVAAQIELIVQWMRVGFVHGVMNTDNMSISGETLDYGPCAFLDAYDPAAVFSSIDHLGRYAFAQQSRIAAWNLARLAEALLPLIAETPEEAVALAQERVDAFQTRFRRRWLEMMREKMGFLTEQDGDDALADALLDAMAQTGADYTNAFRAMTDGDGLDALEATPALQEPLARWRARRAQEGRAGEARAIMSSANPVLIPRNHRVEAALDAATQNGDMELFNRLLNALARPYDKRPDLDDLRVPPAPHERVVATFCGT